MARGLLLGIDLGGGGARSLLLDVETGATTIRSRSWSFPRVEGTLGLGFELDLETLWETIAATVRDVLAATQAAPGEVLGIAVAALRFGNVILDGAGHAVFAVPNRDARAAIEGIELASAHGEAILAETGLWPLPIHASARLQWLRKHDPGALRDDHKLLSLGDWLNFRLCAMRATDFTQAGCTGLFELASRRWSEARIESLDLPQAMFPRVLSSGEPLGGLCEDAARKLGLRAGTPVGVGGADTQCALLGAGATRPGHVGIVAGTTAPVQAVTSAPIVDSRGRVWSGHHVIPGLWVLESNGGPMGESLSWMARLLYPDAREPEACLLEEAARAEVGAAGMLSTLGAEVMNARAPGMPFGQITLTHMTSAEEAQPRKHLCRAIVEGQACAIRANLEQIAEVDALDEPRMNLAGGLSRSEFFTQVVADVCGAPVHGAAQPEATALGAAICAGVAAGVRDGFESAAASWVQTRLPSVASPDLAEAHAELYSAWSRLRDAAETSTTQAARAHVTPWVLRSNA